MLTVGSDTGNSVRNPACNTGVGTIKPTYGLIPLYGATPLTVSLDHAGPICRSMTDVALLLGILAGPDPLDPRSLQAPPAPAYYPLAPTPGDKPLEGVRIGSTIETETSPARTSWAPGILAQLRAAVEQFARSAHDRGGHARDLEPRQHDLLRGRRCRPIHGRNVPASTVYSNSENAYVRDTYTRTADPLLVGGVMTRFRRNAALNGVEAKDQLCSARRRSRRRTCSAPTRSVASTARRGRRSSPTTTCSPACGRRRCRPRRTAPTTAPAASPASIQPPEHTGWPCIDLPVGRDANTGIPVGIDLAAPLGADATFLQIAIDYQARFPYHLDIPTEL